MKETLKLSYTKQVIIEVLNAATHGIGALLSIIATVALILKGVQHSSHLEIVSYAIYGASLFLLFLNSTLYHSFSLTRYKDVFQKIDHSSIYLLIAGTYTPYLMVSIGGLVGYGFLALVWALAIGGIIFEVSSIGRWPKLSTFLYLGLGWLSVFIIYPLAQSIPLTGILLLALGGVTYSLGTIFYRMKDNKWMHIIWHLFVLGGAVFMFYSILYYV
ncbi:hemolysin III family protein [uncultured Abiotrophia sp.]|uniref:PAQR family membrane homeostasis protein TrhA n=1 Tax=uncultured Abiotrophia sp. TaxID=316094 RepID=UPI0028E30F67|nr:hemolysin III family protein [uncultured Abiotrophia sp.]